jgi:hypothetical protein
MYLANIFPHFTLRGAARTLLHCAHRTPLILYSYFQMILPSSLTPLSWNGTRVGPTAAVERGYRCSPKLARYLFRDGG